MLGDVLGDVLGWVMSKRGQTPEDQIDDHDSIHLIAGMLMLI